MTSAAAIPGKVVTIGLHPAPQTPSQVF